jgi:predicted pyridoxine 5'-phosphate oxidase superfamily flavin-nucleotide-binding protein
MERLNDDIIHFFKRQGCVIVATIDKDGYPHTSCKGIVDIEEKGVIYLLDLYKAKTYKNLKKNRSISITAVDEHRFKGYCLKGKAEITHRENLDSSIIDKWEQHLAGRITKRLLKNIHGEKGYHLHAEAQLPNPEYLISIKVEEVINLTPPHIK